MFAGESVVFWVTVAGLDPLAYQWQFDGADLQDGDRISGSSTSTLRISPVVPADAGTYTVIVSNVHGSVTSNPAELAVLLRPPEILASSRRIRLSSAVPWRRSRRWMRPAACQ